MVSTSMLIIPCLKWNSHNDSKSCLVSSWDSRQVKANHSITALCSTQDLL